MGINGFVDGYPPDKAITHHMAIKPNNRETTFQDRPSSHPSPPCYQEGEETMKIAFKFRNSYLEMLYENSPSNTFRKTFM